MRRSSSLLLFFSQRQHIRKGGLVRRLTSTAVSRTSSRRFLLQSQLERLLSYKTLATTGPRASFQTDNEGQEASGYSSNQKQDKLMGFSNETFNGMNSEFPCLLENPSRGPEPEYDKVVSGYKTFVHENPFYFKYNRCILPKITIAYETWGKLNADKSNAILLGAGLSASSHARSHPENEKPGWWEKFIGPGCALDTDKYFIICANTLGGCYGSSGPSSINPGTKQPYGTTFPLVSVVDMVNAQFLLLDHLGIDKLYAAVGSSLGGMQSLNAAVKFADRVSRLVSISACALSHPSSIAVRYLQRKCIMTDPSWREGHYYGHKYPRNGMKMAREMGTMTYRSGPEWSERFARKRINDDEDPALCPTFLIESYLDYQGEMFCTMYDPNSLLYISKAMDLFDISEDYEDMNAALKRVTCPAMVLGVKTDLLFPIWQQRELAAALRSAGNDRVTFYELDAIYGHDTFLLDLNGVGLAVKGFLETEQSVTGRIRPRQDRN
ncbi:uncharacterized protein [Watersipora subatra]|uniref:uncharacterized protein n=1 Tax=Watersipora subatra TaxID=2589382 RepID=UPI00355C1A6F